MVLISIWMFIGVNLFDLQILMVVFTTYIFCKPFWMLLGVNLYGSQILMIGNRSLLVCSTNPKEYSSGLVSKAHMMLLGVKKKIKI